MPKHVVLACLAALSWTGWMVCLKYAVARIGPTKTTVLSLVAEIAVIIVGLIAVKERWTDVSPLGGFLAVLGGVFGVVGLELYNRATEAGPIAVVAPLSHVYIALAAVLGMVLLRESFTARDLAGIALVLAGIGMLVPRA